MYQADRTLLRILPQHTTQHSTWQETASVHMQARHTCMQACQDITHSRIASGITPHLCMCRQGVDLVRAEYIPDDIEDIKQTVLRLKERVGPNGVIFSSGGIGPTHDDVTYEALAGAFGVCSNIDMDSVTFKALATGLHWCTCLLCMFTHVRQCLTRMHMHVEASWMQSCAVQSLLLVPTIAFLHKFAAIKDIFAQLHMTQYIGWVCCSLYCLCRLSLLCISLQPSKTFCSSQS